MDAYYQDDYCTIYHGDCQEILPTLPKVDLVLTDPPYGIDLKTNYSERGRSKLAICNDYPEVHGDKTKFDPRFILDMGVPTALFGANYFADELPVSSGWIVWDKLRPELIDQAHAELAWTNFVKGVRVFRHLWHGMMRASERGESYHPTQKPVALMKWILTLKWTPAGMVLDPFMGSGTTLRAAKDLQRKAIGIEIEEKYCEIAAKRLQQEVLDFNNAKQITGE